MEVFRTNAKWVLLLAVAAASSAIASELPFDSPTTIPELSSSVVLPQGELRVLPADDQGGGQVLAVDETRLDLHGTALSLAGAQAGSAISIVAVADRSGGTACPMALRIVVVTTAKATIFPSLSECDDRVHVFGARDALVVRYPSAAYVADGTVVRPIDTGTADDWALESILGKVRTDRSILLRPLVEPDGELYRWPGVVEHVERVEGKELWLLAFAGQTDMRFVVISEAHVEGESPSRRLRIGDFATVTGYYVLNTNDSATHGFQRTMPVLKAVMIRPGA